MPEPVRDNTNQETICSTCMLRDVGIESLNQQHLKLAQYANELQGIVEDLTTREPTHDDWKRIDALFSRITLYVATHFREEEELMRLHGYPDYGPHKKLHDEFEIELLDVQRKVNNRNIKFKGKLSTMLWNFLNEHVNVIDLAYRDFFLGKGVS